MHIQEIKEQLSRQASRRGISYELGGPASKEAVDQLENRLGQRLPDPVRTLYVQLNGLRVGAPRPARLFPAEELRPEGNLLPFALLGDGHRMAYRFDRLNDTGQWTIVAMETGFAMTRSIAHFLTVKLMVWVKQGKEIWIPAPHQRLDGSYEPCLFDRQED